MPLIEETKRTEQIAIKTNKALNNTNSKLIEMGGQSAIDLADVQNKINNMITENYLRIAEGTYNTDLKVKDNDKKNGVRIDNNCLRFTKKIPLNLSFVPKRIIFKFNYMNSDEKIKAGLNYEPFGFSVDSKYNYSIETSAGMGDLKYPVKQKKVYIKEMSNKEVTIIMTAYESANYPDYFFMKSPIYWTALG